MTFVTRSALAAGFVLLAAPAFAQSSEADYAKRFDGSFNGGGKVRTEANASPWNVKCKVTGNSSATSLKLAGSCTAAAIVTRQIGADLTISPNGTYTGTYTGSKIGPARISGKRSGDTVTLAVTWPKEVNGDTKATMTITNKGNGFTFAVDDLDKPGGKTVRMTDINLSK
ncbi:hypothetical protein [Terrihabitans rhizophilus]|jgi:hypothetical protein|uniref:Uncharacterized protein n=1 Tax=Terrihabitans rhizophilus TaxID=3092662 RepID=A0ABU4RLE0_9HYPH|nr:hypothetical protein [Terrihabitans sp. PJ23]MDX6805649.1 hypothetical protein [Terrihabitans sp. PJ23]